MSDSDKQYYPEEPFETILLSNASTEVCGLVLGALFDAEQRLRHNAIECQTHGYAAAAERWDMAVVTITIITEGVRRLYERRIQGEGLGEVRRGGSSHSDN